MKLRRRIAPFSLLILCPLALASGKSYLYLVGQLFGSAETPRLIRDFCATRSPDTASENAKLYDDWQFRHAELLAGIAIQVAHADVRLRRQNPPADVQSFGEIRANMKAKLEETLQQNSPGRISQFCTMYPKYIEKKDEEARTTIKQLLSTVEAADKELASREKT
jgi:hypothetical protein